MAPTRPRNPKGNEQMAMQQDIAAVSAEVPQALAGEIADWLAEHETYASVWEDREGGPSRVEIFLPSCDGDPAWAAYGDSVCRTPEEAATKIREAGAAFGLELEPATATIRAEDWAESWKRFFKVVRISERIVVRPPWERYDPRPGEVVLVLDPGMSFGTGKHATTQACLRMLDELAAENPRRGMLDIGCGSGILSIAAAKLGFAPVKGIDNDPDAVRIAAENAAENAATADFAVCDLAQCKEKAEVVVANVLAPVLERHAAAVAGCVRRVPGNALVLSGILDSQYDDVRKAYEALGAVERRSVAVGEWRTGLFEMA